MFHNLKRVAGAGLVAIAAGLLAGPSADVAAARGRPQGGQTSIAAPGGLEVLQLRPNFFMIAGGGGNVGVQIGEDGVIVIDAGSSAKAADVLTAIQKLTPKPIRYIIDTSADPDHVGGNETISKAGQTLFTAAGSIALPGNFLGGVASILSAEGVLTRMSAPTGQTSPYPAEALPTETFDQPRKYMFLNGEGIEVLHQPAAHTDGDAVVFFRRSDVVVAGDILDMTRFPVIDVARGGTIEGTIAALSRVVDLAIPSVPIVSREAGTIVIPGHGHLCDQFDVVEYRDMVSIIRDRVRDLRDAGMTLDQIQAASPARGYTRRYGSDSGPWTTTNFVEAIYKSLPKGKR
ncbi:MAG TPA: MBL fold metallo-hydrolase [Vicinamibacterales bacterium]|nr:MBL fold metallo-hydrolase [Vicinamibacterales bacterium]